MWRRTLDRLALAALAGAVLIGAAHAQQDPKAAERAQRRAQMQLQTMQQQLDEAKAARAQAEAQNAELAEQRQAQKSALARASSNERKLAGDLKAAQDEAARLTARLAQLEQQTAAQMAELKSTHVEAIAAREREGVEMQRRRDVEAAALRAQFAAQVRLVTQCTDKNERLARVGLELMDRYRNKGLAEIARDSDPVLGLADVQAFNLLQEYRDRLDAERFKPVVEPRP